MKIFLASIILIMLSSCSFDNKTGIWENSSETTLKKERTFKDFENLYTKTQSFNSIVEIKDNLEINLDPVKSINSRSLVGGTAPSRVRKEINTAKKVLARR